MKNVHFVQSRKNKNHNWLSLLLSLLRIIYTYVFAVIAYSSWLTKYSKLFSFKWTVQEITEKCLILF